MAETVRPKSLVAFIAEDLEKKILSGTFKQGLRLIEAELCRSYGVSQTPLREALRILESNGYVTHKPRKGAFVSETSIDEIEEIFRIRANLESLATYLAVKRCTPGVISELKKIHQKMITVAAKKDVKAYIALNFKFHDGIINASQSKRLIQMIQTFVKQTDRFRLDILKFPEMLKTSIEAHENVIQLFESGDAEKAERMRRDSILNRFKVYIRKVKEGKIEMDDFK
jgi:DNA-binding GntR family transcriptional regulator